MQIIVATGFVAKNPQGQVTTLKRNGSDYSATIIGALLRGAHITIWTDVDGVFSADPRKVTRPGSAEIQLEHCSKLAGGATLHSSRGANAGQLPGCLNHTARFQGSS